MMLPASSASAARDPDAIRSPSRSTIPRAGRGSTPPGGLSSRTFVRTPVRTGRAISRRRRPGSRGSSRSGRAACRAPPGSPSTKTLMCVADHRPAVDEPVAQPGRPLVEPVDRLGDGRRLDLACAAARPGTATTSDRGRMTVGHRRPQSTHDASTPQIGGRLSAIRLPATRPRRSSRRAGRCSSRSRRRPGRADRPPAPRGRTPT